MWENYLSEFKNPSSRFRGAPFWAWNCKLDKETILKQIDYFSEMGMGGFTMHCRTGLDTPYMKEEYMDIVRACIEKAKNLDMKAYLYDEDRWPSGSCGGEVTKDRKYRSRFMVFTPHNSQNNERRKFISKYNITLENGYMTDYKCLDENEDGENVWYAYLEICGDNPWYNNQAYVNTLDKEAIEKFIEFTYEKYYNAAGEDFGDTVPSIFTDEPQFEHKRTLGKAEDRHEIIIPYTDKFEEEYYKEYNESFLECLPEVFWELPDGKISVTRYRYHDYLSELFAVSFADTIGKWCEEHNIKLTGHVLLEETLGSQTRAVGEAMRHYRGFGIPGIDILCDNREYTTAKQAQSAAHQMGKNQVLSELYGVTNWDFDFRGHKLQGDWQAALGVTNRVHHLSWVSMAGESKRDYPASIFYQSPWYKKYGAIETYFGRINTALQSGLPDVKIGVIHPIESYWLYYGPEEQTFVMKDKLEKQFEQVTSWMLFGLLDFNYIAESLLKDFSKEEHANSDKFQVGKMEYDAVVIPGCHTLRKNTVDKLERFIKNGGKVIFMGDIPKFTDAVPDNRPSLLAQKSQCIEFDYSSLMQALSECRTVDMHNGAGVRSDRHIYQMRKLGEDRILFIANGKRERNKDIPIRERYSVEVKGIYDVVLMDTVTGDEIELCAEYKNDTTVITYDFHEHDSLLLYLNRKYENNGEKTVCNYNMPNIEYVKTLKSTDEFSLSEPNVLLLDQAEYSLDGEVYRASEEILRMDNVLRSELGYPQKMEALAQPWTMEKEEQSSHVLKLKYTFISEIKLRDVKIAMERPEEAEIFLNNSKIHIAPDGYYTDECIKTIPLPEIVKGQNEIIITIPYSKRTNLESIFILGDFGVYAYGNRAKIVPLTEELAFGDATPQTLPFYGGNITYKVDIDVDEGEYELEITKYRAPMISVKVDGKEVGNIIFSPYRVFLGKLNGKHNVEVTVYGNRVNTFGALHMCDENMKWFGPNAWRLGGAQFSYEYNFRRTGILTAPNLYRRNVK